MKPPTPREFIAELEQRGIQVGGNFVRPRLASLAQASGDFIGVGRVVV